MSIEHFFQDSIEDAIKLLGLVCYQLDKISYCSFLGIFANMFDRTMHNVASEIVNFVDDVEKVHHHLSNNEQLIEIHC